MNREKLYNEKCRLDGLHDGCESEDLRVVTGAVSCLYNSLYVFHIDGYDGIRDAREYLYDTDRKYPINIPPEGWNYCIKSSIKEVISIIESIDGIRLLDYYSDVHEVSLEFWIEILLAYIDQIIDLELLGEGE